jgi:hypothetical protein
MADLLDRIRKLMALALKNPNHAEASSAALKAVALIDAHHVTLLVAAPVDAETTIPVLPKNDVYDLREFLRWYQQQNANRPK